MIKMVVTRSKPIRYPTGPHVRVYRKGQEFDVLSERDAKALSLIRAAKRLDQPATKTTEAKAPEAFAEVPAQVPPAEAPAEPAAPAEAEDSPAPRRYRRRDMRAED